MLRAPAFHTVSLFHRNRGMLHGASMEFGARPLSLDPSLSSIGRLAVERGLLSQMRRPLLIPSQSIHLVPLPAPLFFGYSIETRVKSCIRCGGDGGSGRLPGAAFWPRRHFKLRADDPTTALRVLQIRSRALKPRAVARGRSPFNPHAHSR